MFKKIRLPLIFGAVITLNTVGVYSCNITIPQQLIHNGPATHTCTVVSSNRRATYRDNSGKYSNSDIVRVDYVLVAGTSTSNQQVTTDLVHDILQRGFVRNFDYNGATYYGRLNANHNNRSPYGVEFRLCKNHATLKSPKYRRR